MWRLNFFRGATTSNSISVNQVAPSLHPANDRKVIEIRISSTFGEQIRIVELFEIIHNPWYLGYLKLTHLSRRQSSWRCWTVKSWGCRTANLPGTGFGSC